MGAFDPVVILSLALAIAVVAIIMMLAASTHGNRGLESLSAMYAERCLLRGDEHAE